MYLIKNHKNETERPILNSISIIKGVGMHHLLKDIIAINLKFKDQNENG